MAEKRTIQGVNDKNEPFSCYICNQNSPPGGQWGSPKFYFCCDSKPHAKFQDPTITPSGRKVSEAERKKERERKNALIVDT